MAEVPSPSQLQAEVSRLNNKLTKIRIVVLGVGGFVGLFLLSFVLQSRGSAERLRAEGRREEAAALGATPDNVHKDGLTPEAKAALEPDFEPFMTQMREYHRQQALEKTLQDAQHLRNLQAPEGKAR